MCAGGGHGGSDSQICPECRPSEKKKHPCYNISTSRLHSTSFHSWSPLQRQRFKSITRTLSLGAEMHNNYFPDELVRRTYDHVNRQGQ